MTETSTTATTLTTTSKSTARPRKSSKDEKSLVGKFVKTQQAGFSTEIEFVNNEGKTLTSNSSKLAKVRFYLNPSAMTQEFYKISQTANLFPCSPNRWHDSDFFLILIPRPGFEPTTIMDLCKDTAPPELRARLELHLIPTKITVHGSLTIVF